MPSWPGARSAWPMALRDCSRKVGPPPFVGGSLPPSQNSIANGRSGKTRSISVRSGAELLMAPNLNSERVMSLGDVDRALAEVDGHGAVGRHIGGDRPAGGDLHPAQVQADRRGAFQRRDEPIARRRLGAGVNDPRLPFLD